jgi:hypothetical protein
VATTGKGLEMLVYIILANLIFGVCSFVACQPLSPGRWVLIVAIPQGYVYLSMAEPGWKVKTHLS